MTDLVFNFYKARELVVDKYANTLATAKDCLRLLQNRGFVGCEENLICFVESLPSLVKSFALQVLKPESDLVEKRVFWNRARCLSMPWNLFRKKDGRTVEVCHPVWFLRRYFLCTLCVSLGICAKTQHYTRSEDTFHCYRGFTSRNDSSMAWM